MTIVCLSSIYTCSKFSLNIFVFINLQFFMYVLQKKIVKWKEKNPWCRSIVFWYQVKLWIFSPGFGLATSPAIVYPCSRHARTVTVVEHAQFPLMFLKSILAHHGIFSQLFFLLFIFRKINYPLFCLIVISTGKSSKFERKGKIVSIRTSKLE